MSRSARASAFSILENDGIPSRLRRGCDALFTLAIFAWLAEGVFRTVPTLGRDVLGTFGWLELSIAVLFASEWALRVWIAPEQYHEGAMTATNARRLYLFSPLGLLDAAIPIVYFFGDRTLGLGGAMIEIVELLAVFKLTRYFPGLDLVFSVLRTEIRPLGAALAAMLTLLLLASSVMYYLERDAQPDMFASIPASMWWGIVTIATVGYGDMAPVTPFGRLATGVVMLIGIALFALPAGILANGFAVELKRRDFLVTWRLVAKLPIFADLDAAVIASIARLLQPRAMPKDSVVIRKGEPAHGMYFVLSGELEVHVPNRTVRLGQGSYFGEMALLSDQPRSATVVANVDCELLELGSAEFKRVCAEYPLLKERVEAEAARRAAASAKP
ncbi:MAG: cyclic nucleotide-binding domain-containing protein [Telmatospirillum sp.]|nr:cyclic nucleotide-binding domain-containing protein [Telmatospirillum sp.]